VLLVCWKTRFPVI